MIEVNDIIRQPSIGGFEVKGIRRDVKVVRDSGEWLGYNDLTVFADIIGWSGWGRRSQAARPDHQWRTLWEETVVVVEYDRGETHFARPPAGTVYRLAKGGNPHSAATIWVRRPDRRYGPKVVR